MKQWRVMLLADSKKDIDRVTALLGEDFFDVTAFTSAPQFLKAVKRNTPDLVIVDMGIERGLEIIEQIRMEPALEDLPAIALTAEAIKGSQEKLLEAGFDDHFPKPIREPSTLIDALLRLL